MRTAALATALFLLVPLSACKGGGTTGGAARDAMGAYAEGYNEVINNIPDFFKSYSRSVDPTKGAKGYKGAWSICSGIWMKLDTVKKGFEAGKDRAPDELKQIGPLADKLYASAEEIDKLRGGLCKYIKGEDFKDDDGAKGKEFDTKLAAAYKTYRENVSAMDEALTGVEDQQMVSALKEHEKSKSYSYWWRKLNYESSQLLKKLKKPEALAGTADLITAWEAHQAEITKWAEGKGAKLHGSMESYIGQVDRFHASAKKLRRAVAEGKDEAAKAKALNSGFGALVSSYNSMISITNGLSTLEANSLLKDK